MTNLQQDIEAQRKKLSSLVDRYAANRSEYINPAYGETSLRVEFLDPFFCLLGWDVNNESGISIYSREVIHEANVTVDDEGDTHANKKPDYAFRIGGETKFFLEAKKPSVDIVNRRESAFQARRYGWSGNHAIVVLSNFEDFSIYDCGYRPIDTQEPSFARIAHYSYDELVEHFDEIYSLISKEAVAGGSLEAVDAREQAAKVPFDDLFLAQISSWRMDISLDVYKHYGAVDMDVLNQFTQILLDRIIFLRVCEDRHFENEEELLGITSYKQLKDLFVSADEKYGSGLFNYLDDAPWQVSDYILIDIFQDLYYPNSSYDFNVVQPHVIGHIYEKFLGERIHIENRAVRVESTPEAIESNGVVPTPKEITDAIVANTLKDTSFPCKVADICCGSGNFLLSIYEHLVSKDLMRVIDDGDDEIHLIDRESGPDLPYWRKRQILSEAIYGVDIDPLAVEVAQLSLSLRLLEGCSSEELDSYRRITGKSLLPNLSSNVKCGNSLVGYQYFDYDASAMGDIKKLRSVKPFDWGKEFCFGKFDAIVGNPPYIRVQHLVHYIPEEYGFYKSDLCDLKMASVQALDKYQLFVERALGLLKKHGKLGLIIPNKFMTIDSGKPLRRLLTRDYHISRIVDFGAVQVFQGRSTYTCILIATPENVPTFTRRKVVSLPEFVESPLTGGVAHRSNELSGDPWGFPPEVISKHLNLISETFSQLSDIANIFVGLQTSNDAAYIFEPVSETNGVYEFKDLTGKSSKIEKSLCRPCLLDVSFEQYSTPMPNRQIIFPYEVSDAKASLIPILRLKNQFPYAYKYFCSIKSILEVRALGPRSKTDDWYKFGRSQSLRKFVGKSHLVWPVLSIGPKYVIDYSGTVMFTGGGNGPYYGLELKDGTPECLEYVQAVLSYWLTELLVRSKTSVFSGGYYSHGKQFIAGLPVRRIDFRNREEVTLYEKAVDLVKELNDLTSRRQSATAKSDAVLLSRSIEAAERSLRETMDVLYDADKKLEEEAMS